MAWEIEHNGYRASVRYDKEDRIYVGEVLNVPDKVAFHGNSLYEIVTMFPSVLCRYEELKQQEEKENEG